MRPRVLAAVLRSTVLGVLLGAVLLAAASLAPQAFAAPAEPVLGLSGLQALLDAAPAGTLDGSLKTVVRGASVQTVPVRVLAIAGDTDPSSALILVQVSGPVIDAAGGIAAGMSGSPIYVGGKLIGALSYGDNFTLGGTALATPIEAMMRLETDYSPRVERLGAPVFASGTVIDRVVIAPDPNDFAGIARQGALVARPLGSVFIGGLRPTSGAYRLLAAGLGSQGLSVVPLANALGASASTDGAAFSTPFVPGSSVGALASRGDLWVGAVGTVTYISGPNVVAFGHPAYHLGEPGLYLTNAWIDGVWPSQAMPYKLGRPGAVRGTVTQDRSAGVLGVNGLLPAEAPITARAIDAQTGRVTTSATYMPREVLGAAWLNPEIPAVAAYMASEKLLDAAYVPGSAIATSTIVVSDGRELHTVRVGNVFDDASDIRLAAMGDVLAALVQLQTVNDFGVETLDIRSIDLTAEYSASRRAARIVDVELPYGLKTGANRVRVKLVAYGVAATQTVDATLTVPGGTPLEGTIEAVALDAIEQDPEDEDGSDAPAVGERRGIAQIVSAINAVPGNNVLLLRYTPDSEGGYLDDVEPVAPPAQTTVATPWVVSGGSGKAVVAISATASPRTVGYGGSTKVSGRISARLEGATVSVYGTAAGGSETLLATTTATPAGLSSTYRVTLKGLTRNTSLRVRLEDNAAAAAAETRTSAKVRARVKVNSSARSVVSGRPVTLTAAVNPGVTAGSRVTFERYDAKRGAWRTIATRTLAAKSGSNTARATLRWTPPRGSTRVRARFLGGPTNAAATSSAITIRAR